MAGVDVAAAVTDAAPDELAAAGVDLAGAEPDAAVLAAAGAESIVRFSLPL